MNHGYAREPKGIAADCFYVLAMYDNGHGLTGAELQQRIAAENTALDCTFPTVRQVSNNLINNLAKYARPLVRRDEGRWKITDHGWAMLDRWCGADEPDLRRPCGLGWPA